MIFEHHCQPNAYEWQEEIKIEGQIYRVIYTLISQLL